jgi:hypothetical protein
VLEVMHNCVAAGEVDADVGIVVPLHHIRRSAVLSADLEHLASTG